MTPKYQTIPEWCAATGMGRSKFYELLAAGELRAVKLGRRCLIDVEHGLAFMSRLPPADVRLPSRSAKAAA